MAGGQSGGRSSIIWKQHVAPYKEPGALDSALPLICCMTPGKSPSLSDFLLLPSFAQIKDEGFG